MHIMIPRSHPVGLVEVLVLEKKIFEILKHIHSFTFFYLLQVQVINWIFFLSSLLPHPSLMDKLEAILKPCFDFSCSARCGQAFFLDPQTNFELVVFF